MTLASCATWDCVNSFANWLSAIGTLLVTGLALWLSIRDRIIHLSAVLDVGLLPGHNPNILDRQVYILSFTNVGPRPVTVTNHRWGLPFKRGVVYFMPHMDPHIGGLCSKLPIELTDGKEGHAFYARDFFSKLDAPEKFLFHKNRAIAWLRIQFFQVWIDTTIGKRIPVKVRRSVRRKLWDTYRNA